MPQLAKRARDYLLNVLKWSEPEPKYTLIDNYREITSCFIPMTFTSQNAAASSWKYAATQAQGTIPRGCYFKPFSCRVYCANAGDTVNKIGITNDRTIHHALGSVTASRDAIFIGGQSLAECLIDEGFEIAIFFSAAAGGQSATVTFYGMALPNGKSKRPEDYWFSYLEW